MIIISANAQNVGAVRWGVQDYRAFVGADAQDFRADASNVCEDGWIVDADARNSLDASRDSTYPQNTVAN